MTDQERQDILAVVGADDWRAVVREQMEELRWGPDRLAASMSDGEYYVTGKTVRRWLSDIEPKLDSIRRMALALARGRNWSKARYLSWNRVVDAIRPTRTPRILRRLALVPVAAVLLALVPMPAQAQTIDWGPGGTAYGAMTPPWTSPTIRVVDSLAGTLRPERRRIWIKARNQALANWTPGGVTFQVERIAGISCEGIPDAVQICRGAGDATGWPLADGAVITLHLWAPLWKDFPNLTGTIGHEVGHTLGFGHGGTGIMGGGSNRPNAVELTALLAYWG